MLLKLALRNIRRSVRDYAIYFVTLIFGVAVFYAFNSIGSQQVLFDLETSARASIFETTQDLLGLFSVVISCVLGFLIVYANRFLIRRRKREFGTYLVLGMQPGSVSRIVLYETVIGGLASLVVGLVIGILLSQGLSFVTASLFGVSMSHYQFVFSPAAFWATMGCFAVIYVVVALFNTASISRYKLIDLLNADARNERGGVRNPWVCLAAFIVAVGILAFAYQQLIESGMIMLDDPRFLRATVAMLVGSLLFFWSLAGFAIAVLTRLRGVYLRGLSLFTIRQIASKVNTAFVSLWAVCVLLFFSITTFSCGMGLVQVFTGDINRANPYDATLAASVYYATLDESVRPDSTSIDERAREMEAVNPERYADGVAYAWNMAAKLQAGAPELWDDTVGSWAQVDSLEVPGVTYQPLAEEAGATIPSDLERAMSPNIQVVALSQINANRALCGQPAITLAEDECCLLNNMSATEKIARDIVAARPSLPVLGRTLTFAPDLYDTQLNDNALLSTALVIAVPDSLADELRAQGAIPTSSYLNLMYADNGLTDEENGAQLSRIVAASQPLDMDGFYTSAIGDGAAWESLLWPVTHAYTAAEMKNQSGGLRMLITYLALYIGLIFLVSTATILAIQQLSEASDSSPRYRTLWKLGCDQRMIYRSLLLQVIVYFLVPLGLAVCHAACAIGVLSSTLLDVLGVPVDGPIAMAAALTTLVYGGYLVVTYLASRSVVSGALKQA
ncbi:MAG: ABC transporter permease [Eggerthellaceae bacterium]|nr:ABC transporter permease [Eggerthellaceae bacterium]